MFNGLRLPSALGWWQPSRTAAGGGLKENEKMVRWQKQAPVIGKRKGFKISFSSTTKEQVIQIAENWLASNPNSSSRKMSEPDLLKNGQYRIFVS